MHFYLPSSCLVGLILATFVNPSALGISMLLIIGIISYNYRIKNGFFRPYLMAGIRSLNVIYGASFVFDLSNNTATVNGDRLISYAGSLFSITYLGIMCCVFSYFYPDLSQQKRNNQRIFESQD